MYKATRPDGRSFRGGELEWKVGETTTHPTSTKMIPDDAATYLSASTEKAECTGFSWPCRLFEVEPLPEGSFRYYNAKTGEQAKLTPEGRPDGTETIRVVDLGRVLDGLGYPHKRAALAFRVVRELDAFGPRCRLAAGAKAALQETARRSSASAPHASSQSCPGFVDTPPLFQLQ